MYSVEEILNFNLVSLVKTLNSQAEPYLKDAGILYSHYGAMVTIYEHPGIRQSDLAQLKATDRTTVGHTVDRLEELSYVERRRKTSDRRAFHLYLTEKGENIVTTFWIPLKKVERQVLKNLSDKEVDELFALLDKALNGEETENGTIS